MSIYNMFKTDSELESKGTWIDYGEENGAFLVSHIMSHHSGYDKRLQAKLKPYRRQIENDTISADVAERIMVETFAEKGLLDWKNVKDENGNKLPHSVENAKKLLMDLPMLYRDLFDQAKLFSNFRASELEEDAKNSESA